MKKLEGLFLEELADMYDTENRLTRALPRMVKQATHLELREAFAAHLQVTQQQLRRLTEVFDAFGKKAKARKCDAIIGLLKEAAEIAADNKGCATINAALISAAQKVEHYEIASYGCLVEWAKRLEQGAAVRLLQETLDEEKGADETLTRLARERCNDAAQNGEPTDEEAGHILKGRGTRRARSEVRNY